MSDNVPEVMPEALSERPVSGGRAGDWVPHYTSRLDELREGQQARVDRLRQLQERHHYFDGRRDQRLDLWVRGGESPTECLVVADALLAPTAEATFRRNDDPAAVSLRLRGLGYTSDGVDQLATTAFTVHRRLDPPPGPFAVNPVDAALALQRAGVQVHPLYVVPTQVVIKSNLTPELPGDGRPPALRDVPVWDDYVVAVIDTGISEQRRSDGWLDVPEVRTPPAHPRGNVDPLNDLGGFLAAAGGHGTFVSGIVQQVEPRALIRMYRPFTLDGLATDIDLAHAIREAVDEAFGGPNPARALVVNLSCGTTTADGQPLPATAEALAYAMTFPNVAVVAAAGNNGTTEPVYPAASDGVVSVGALTARLKGAGWSSHGDWVMCSAVGEGLVSTFVEGIESPLLDPAPEAFGADAWATWIGTSFCAPQVSAMILKIAQRDGVSPREAVRRLLYGRPRLPGYGQLLRILPGA